MVTKMVHQSTNHTVTLTRNVDYYKNFKKNEMRSGSERRNLAINQRLSNTFKITPCFWQQWSYLLPHGTWSRINVVSATIFPKNRIWRVPQKWAFQDALTKKRANITTSLRVFWSDQRLNFALPPMHVLQLKSEQKKSKTYDTKLLRSIYWSAMCRHQPASPGPDPLLAPSAPAKFGSWLVFPQVWSACIQRCLDFSDYIAVLDTTGSGVWERLLATANNSFTNIHI